MSSLAALLLPRYADGRLPRPLRGWLRRRLRKDDALRSHYNGLRRQQQTPDRGLSSTQMRVVLQAILDDVAMVPHRRDAATQAAQVSSALLAAALTATLFFGGAIKGQLTALSASQALRRAEALAANNERHRR